MAAESVAPVLASIAVPSAGNAVVLTITEAGSPPLLPASGILGFTLKVNTVVRTFTAAMTGATEVTLTPSSRILATDTVTVSYNQGTGNVTDSADVPNELTAFTDHAVTNNSTEENVAPVIASASVPAAGTTVIAEFTETGHVPLLPSSGITGLTVKADGVDAPVDSAARSGNTEVTVTMVDPLRVGQTVTLSYSQATGNLTDSDTNECTGFTDHAVTNASTVLSDAETTLLGAHRDPSAQSDSGNAMVDVLLNGSGYSADQLAVSGIRIGHLLASGQ